MTTATNQVTSAFERALERLAETLAISDTHYQAAERSYLSVAKWLNRPESSVSQHAPSIYSQGSFRLGTVIRPLTDEDCFDLDVVCEVSFAKDQTTQEQLKNAIGKELAEYVKNKGMTEPPEPGQYCWTLQYADDAQFKMDVVPAIPDAAHQRMLLEAVKVSAEWVASAIGLTNTKHPQFRVICRDWPPSNPRGYAAWFRSRMKDIFLARRRHIATEGKVDIEKIPEYRVRTPLQSAVQLLKRHRDGTFADRPDVKPASIVVTTLAAHAYNQEETLVGALFSILSGMDRFIERRDGHSWISNPTDGRENFADRWKTEPASKEAFYEWLETVRADFHAASGLSDQGAITEQLAHRMGRALLERAAGSSLAPTAPKPTTALTRILSAPHRQAPTWPLATGGASSVRIASATVARDGFRTARFTSNGPALAKRSSLKFEAQTNAQSPYEVYWQVVNTGQEARDANGLRGSFEQSRIERGLLTKRESTLYTGTHSIECFIVKNGYCVAKSGPFIVNIR
jgi:hypothetical protein